MERSPRVAVDWLSRLLSFISVFAAAGAIGYIVTNPNSGNAISDEDFANRVKKVLDEQEQSFDESKMQALIDATLQQHADNASPITAAMRTEIENAVHSELVRTHQDRNDEINQAITKINDRADSLLKSATNQFNTWDKQMEGLYKDSIDSYNQLVAFKDQVSSDSTETSSGKKALPDDLIAQVVLRPVAEDDQLFRITNDQEDTLEINEIAFTPLKNVNASQYPDDHLAKGVERTISMVFGQHHNTNKKKDHHATYRMQLSEPIQIAPGENRVLQLSIGNSEYLGYGFLGTVTVNGDESMRIKNVRVMFERDN